MATTFFSGREAAPAARHIPAVRPGARLGAGRLIAFSAVIIPVTAAQMPLNTYLPAIFAQSFGMPLATLGLIFLVEKVWGALADPIIGVLSDRTRSRFGRRRAWIAAGGAVFGLAGLLLFFPVLPITPLYLGLALFVFYLGWSMIQIPFLAWSGEISDDYEERTRIAGYQAVLSAVALLLVLVLPTIVDQLQPHNGRLKLGAMGVLVLASLIPTLLLTLFSAPEPPAPHDQAPRAGLAEAFRLVLGDGALMRVLGSDFAVALGQSIRGSLFVFFVSLYIDLPRWASGLFLLQFVFGVVAGPIWMMLGRRFGKHQTAVAGELLQAAINLGLLFVVRGQPPLLLALTVAQGLTQGSGNLMLRAMVADVADRRRLERGRDCAALYFSVFSISAKGAMAAAVGLALPLVAWLGFDPKSHHNTPAALHGLLLVFALGPALCHLVSASLIAGFPLDAAAHARIRQRLAERGPTLHPHPAE